jgi:hypothetical protein
LTQLCTAIKRDGSPCTLPSTGPDGLCWAHDPKNAEKRRKGQSRGGRSKPSREVQAIKARLSDLADSVLLGNTDRADAAVVSQILNTYLRAVSVELKVREQMELEARLEELEKLLEAREGARWAT